jgi:hypothetical protein
VFYVHSSGVVNAVVWSVSGGEQLLGASPLSNGGAISNSGFVIGSFADFHREAQAALWRLQDNSMIELGTLVTYLAPRAYLLIPRDRGHNHCRKDHDGDREEIRSERE